MHRTSILVGTLGALLASAALHAQTAAGDVEAHVAVARAAAGQEHRGDVREPLLPARRGAGPGAAAAGPRAGGAPATPDRANWYASPYKVFDNLYWLGTRQHSSWALRTSAGLMIIDTNFAWATQPEILDGLTALKLDPRDIKYVFISHAHGDHDQGAAELQRLSGAKIVMGAADWEATLKWLADGAGRRPDARAWRRDGRARGHENHAGRYHCGRGADGDTPGTLSYVFPVKDQGKTVMIAYSGGTLTGGFGADGARWDEYIASQKRIAGVAAEVGAAVLLSNHSEYDGAYTKARLVPLKREPGEDNPFVVGADGVQRYFTVMQECAIASKLRGRRKVTRPNEGRVVRRVLAMVMGLGCVGSAEALETRGVRAGTQPEISASQAGADDQGMPELPGVDGPARGDVHDGLARGRARAPRERGVSECDDRAQLCHGQDRSHVESVGGLRARSFLRRACHRRGAA